MHMHKQTDHSRPETYSRQQLTHPCSGFSRAFVHPAMLVRVRCHRLRRTTDLKHAPSDASAYQRSVASSWFQLMIFKVLRCELFARNAALGIEGMHAKGCHATAMYVEVTTFDV
eukprot:5318687-Pleurochrysis_carterae.AAC.1